VGQIQAALGAIRRRASNRRGDIPTTRARASIVWTRNDLAGAVTEIARLRAARASRRAMLKQAHCVLRSIRASGDPRRIGAQGIKHGSARDHSGHRRVRRARGDLGVANSPGKVVIEWFGTKH